MVKVSIIIPAYNEEKLIAGTLESIKKQDFKDYETIVVCNGCTDNTLKIASKHTNKIFQLKERNTSLARNHGANVAEGSKLVFLDADIRLTENILNTISETNGFGTCKAVPNNATLKNKVFINLKNYTNYMSKYIPKLCGSNGIVFIDKSLFNKLKGFDLNLKKGEERHLLVKAKKYSPYNIINNPVILSTRRYDQLGHLNTILYWIKEFFIPSNNEYKAIR